MHYTDGWMWGTHWMGWIFWIAVIGVLVLFATRLRNGELPRESPRQVLDRRYASGEISTEEYEERKAKLARQ